MHSAITVHTNTTKNLLLQNEKPVSLARLQINNGEGES